MYLCCSKWTIYKTYLVLVEIQIFKKINLKGDYNSTLKTGVTKCIPIILWTLVHYLNQQYMGIALILQLQPTQCFFVD